MEITRRNFLTGAAGLAIATALKPQFAATAAVPAATANSINIRDQFDLTREYIHLATFFIASHPKPVREAIEKYRKAIDANPFLVIEGGLFEPDGTNYPLKVKQAAADYFGAKSEEFALTMSTTMGLALVYNGLRIQPGQEILTTTHDHYSHHEAIRLAADKNGASVRRIALFDDFDSITGESIVNRIKQALTPKTRAVGITWVHSASGVKLPVKRIAEMIKQANTGKSESDRTLLIVDGVHGIGVEDETVDSLGCDFLAAGTHKWIFGPRGTGIIWAKETTWAHTRPTVPSFDSFQSYEAWMSNKPPEGPTRADWVAPGGFQAYEHQWAMADAFRFHLQLGKKRVASQIHELNSQCKEGLAAMKHIKLYTPKSPELSAGLVCFDVSAMKREDVVKKLLAKKIIASVTPYGVPYARLAPSLVNTPEEIDIALREIRAMA